MCVDPYPGEYSDGVIHRVGNKFIKGNKSIKEMLLIVTDI